jgi:hypothetical protein
MRLTPALSSVHGGMAILLFSLAIISVVIAVLIAVKPAADPANKRLLKKANTLTLIEFIVAGIVTISGVIAVFTGSSEWSQQWIWLSMTIMVFYTLALVLITKPARLDVAVGGSAVKTGLQVTLQMGHVLLLFVAFALMFLKPI